MRSFRILSLTCAPCRKKIKIPAVKVPRFTASKALKEIVKKTK